MSDMIQTDQSVLEAVRMPKLTLEARSERRATFLAAARRCAASQGYRDFTIDEVCAAAGLSKGAFYVYFNSKQDLLLALLDEETAELDQLMATLEASATPYVDKIRSFARAMLKRGDDPGIVQLRTDLWAAALTEEPVRLRLVEKIGVLRERLRAWIEAGVQAGELQPVPANAMAAILLALADGLMLHGGVDASGFRWANIRKALDHILDAISRPSAP